MFSDAFMVELSKLECANCGHQNERNRGKCDRCNDPIGYGYPNVNIYSDPYFAEELEKRYEEALALCQSEGKESIIAQFEQQLKENSKAVINMDNRLLFELVNNNEHYLPYRRAVEQSKRLIANVFNDPKRIVIDSCFYGLHGGDIVFAALSLDDDGLASYGDVSVVLSVPLVKKRISVFEKNSFVLYDELTREKGWEPVDFPPPTGHFGIWESRHQLAVAKCHTQLDGNEKDEDFCPILLHSTNDQSKDEFIELHIFDKITYFNFQKVKFQAKLTDKQSLIALSIAKEKLEEAGIEIEIA